ncbi:MAG: glycosyltransferase [Nitrospirota bacterium]
MKKTETMVNNTRVSIIIPTHNRKTSLKRTLDALCNQTYPLKNLEVIVVADGCIDGTIELLRGYAAPFVLRVIEQSPKGAAVARNHGAANAMGQILLFLDDDIESTPSLIETHALRHYGRSRQVVIGYSPPVLEGPIDLFSMGLRSWWEDKLASMKTPGHRFIYSDLLSGNFSLETDLFRKANGFNQDFRCREDYELGIRLMSIDASFVFEPNAIGYHHETSDLSRHLTRVYQEGRADVLIGRYYPNLLPVLPFSGLRMPGSFIKRTLLRIAFRLPGLADRFAVRLKTVSALLEWLKLRNRWHQLHNIQHYYWYWRGVSDESNTVQAFDNFTHCRPGYADKNYSCIEIDLSNGIEEAEELLDQERPEHAYILYGKRPIGHIPPNPCAERLSGKHLRQILANELAAPLLKALIAEKVMSRADNSSCQRLHHYRQYSGEENAQKSA